MGPSVCFLTPAVSLVCEDSVGVPDFALQVPVVDFVAEVELEVVAEVEPVEGRRTKIECECIRYSLADG